MDELPDDAPTIARQGLHSDGTEAVSLSEIMDGCCGSVATKDAYLHVESDVPFRADRSRTKQLFENLSGNVFEHGGPGVVVRVGMLDDGDGFYIEDDGPGIPDGERQKIFDAGYSTGGDGLGMGLAIVESVVTAHEWIITVTSGSDGDARFEIRDVIKLPCTGK